jgi:hypothetical protein
LYVKNIVLNPKGDGPKEILEAAGGRTSQGVDLHVFRL